MKVFSIIRPGEYHDSVSLMLVARGLSQNPGVDDAAVLMATPANKGILRDAGLLTPEAEAASPNDLVIAVRAEEAVIETIPALVAAAMKGDRAGKVHEPGHSPPQTLRSAVKSSPQANVAVISVSGQFAAGEAFEALDHGLHVLLFSDNVSLEDEISLKQYASQRGLLLMGPGAGTAIINGVALGFANVIAPGPVGIVSAAGTGLQEVSTLVDRFGSGISQGIGTGGRDLNRKVGGLMMDAGLRALQEDAHTHVIVLVSKPPAAEIAHKLIQAAGESSKATVICFLGSKPETFAELPSNVHLAPTLEAAAWQAAVLAGAAGKTPEPLETFTDDLSMELRQRLMPEQRYIRGLFSGGTLCYEAQVIWQDLLNSKVLSNAPLKESNRMTDSNHSSGHCAVDLGEEEFTVGRLHPMIDNDLRIRRLLQEARDVQVAVILFDVVLGYGAHADPAAELCPAVRKARQIAAHEGRELVFIASVTGTEKDPQRLSQQTNNLRSAGVIVCPSNAAAARLAAGVVSTREA